MAAKTKKRNGTINGRTSKQIYATYGEDTVCGNNLEAYSISQHNETELEIASLNTMKGARKKAHIHSDQGSPFTSRRYVEAAKKKNLQVSIRPSHGNGIHV